MSRAAKIFTHRALRRHHLLGLTALCVILAWSLVWGWTAYHTGKILDSLIAEIAQDGGKISFEKRFTGGTPWAIHAHLEPFTLHMKNGNEIKAEEAVFYINLWNWKAVSGKLHKDVNVKLMGKTIKAGMIKFGFEKPERIPTDYTETGLSFWLQPLGVTFEETPPFALGNSWEEGFFRVRVMGPVPNFMNKRAIAAWNEASGVLEFDRFFINWGPLKVTANGTLGLDTKLQPEGAFSGRVSGLDEAIGALAAQKNMTGSKLTLLRSALNVLSRPSSLTGKSAPIIPVSVQSGQFFLGPVKLLELPPISW